MPSQFSFAVAIAAIAASHPGQSPRLVNKQDVFTADDYPAQSIRNEETGTVQVELKVGADGSLDACTIAISSGHEALDSQTCRLLKARGKFEPARDGRGRPIEADYTEKVTWKLADGPAPTMPRTAWMMRLTLGLNKSGATINCKVESTGVTGQPETCLPGGGRSEDEATDARSADELPDRYGVEEVRFYPVDPDDAPVVQDEKGATLIYRQISRVTITPDGQVIACERILYSGDASPAIDACDRVEKTDFEQSPARTEPSVGTMIESLYYLPATPG